MNIKKFIKIGIAVLFLTAFGQDIIAVRGIRSRRTAVHGKKRAKKRGKKHGKKRGKKLARRRGKGRGKKNRRRSKTSIPSTQSFGSAAPFGSAMSVSPALSAPSAPVVPGAAPKGSTPTLRSGPFTANSNPLYHDWAALFEADCKAEIDYFKNKGMFLTDPNAVLAFVGEWQQKLSTQGANHAAVFGSSYPNYNQFFNSITSWMGNPFHKGFYNPCNNVHALRNLIAAFIDDSDDWNNYLRRKLHRRNIKPSSNFEILWEQAGKVFQNEGVPGLKYLRIAAIDEAFQQYVSKKGVSGISHIYPRIGYLAEGLENDQCNVAKFSGNILRGHPIAITAASRFSGLEVSYAKDLRNVITDLTQGPGTVLQALSALLMRSYAGQCGKLMESIVPVLQGLGQAGIPRMIANSHRTFGCFTAERMSDWIYECTDAANKFVLCSGYFRPRNVDKLEQLRAMAKHVEGNANEFALPVQIVMTEWQWMTQVHMLLAAPDLSQGKLEHGVDADGLCQEICKALVVAQYRAVAELACMLKVPLFVTRVGQGVFGNDETIMKSALEAILKVAQNQGMTIFLEGNWGREIQALGPTYYNNGIHFNKPIQFPH